MPDTFNFPYHRVITKHPESGSGIKMGKGYEYRQGDNAPEQMMYDLVFDSMQYFLVSGVPSATPTPTRNIMALDAFYVANKMHKVFIYPHPVRGNINVRFAKPLEYGTPEKGGTGMIPEFTISIVEQP